MSLFAAATPAQPARGTSTPATPATPDKKITPIVPSFPVSTPPTSTQPAQQATPAQPYVGTDQSATPAEEATPTQLGSSPKAEVCYTCPQSPVIQPEVVQQQSSQETKEVIQNLRTQIGEVQEQLTKELQNRIQLLQTQVAELQSQQQVVSRIQRSASPMSELALTRTLQRGSTGDDVKQLQEFLAQDKNVYPQGLATGFYGPATEAAVKRFQEKNGIEAVGIVGPKTRAMLSGLTGSNCASSTTRPCFDRVTPGRVVGLAAKTGENVFQACINSKSRSLRGFGQTKTALAESEQYQYCFEGNSAVHVRWFSGSASTITGSVLPPSTDITPPVRFNEAPSGTFPAGTTSVTISLNTDENATCKYSADASGVSYEQMANTFSNTNSTSHSSVVSVMSISPSYPTGFGYNVRCQDSAGNVNTDDYPILFSVANNPVPEIVFAQLPGGTVGTPYSAKISVQSGTPPFTWSVAAGALPAGLALATVDGQGSISGNPITAGTFNFTAKVSDRDGLSDTENFSITIAPASSTAILTCPATPDFQWVGSFETGWDPATWNFSTSDSTKNNLENIVMADMIKTKNGALIAGGVKSVKDSAGTITAKVPVIGKSSDNGKTWTLVNIPYVVSDPNRTYDSIRSLAEDKNGVLFAGGSRLWKSNDGGATWIFVQKPPSALSPSDSVVVNNLLVQRDNVLVATVGLSLYGTAEVYRSADSGATWQKLFTHSRWLESIVEADDGALVFMDSEDIQVSDSKQYRGIYRWINGTLTKTFSAYLYWGGNPHQYRIAKNKDGQLFFIGKIPEDPYTGGTVERGSTHLVAYTSMDHGSTWIRGGTLPVSFQNGRVLGSAESEAMYAITYTTCQGDGLYKSSDSGANWALITDGPGSYAWGGFVNQLIPHVEIGGAVLSVARGAVFSNGPVPAPVSTQTTTAPQPVPEIVFAQLPGGTVGTLYSAKISVQSGTPPFAWSIAAGALPAGLALTTVNDQGSISGNPTTSGTFNFTAKVSDRDGLSDTENFSITVAPTVSSAAIYITPPATTRVSVSSNGTQGNNISSGGPAISSNGRYVVFSSIATNLVSDDTNGVSDIFIHDRETKTTTRVNVANDGTQANGPSPATDDVPVISADGRYIVFSSTATNLVSDDTNGMSDIFIHDRETRTTTRVSIADGGSQSNGVSQTPSLSADGRYIVFASDASNLVTGDTNLQQDIFIHDRETRTTTRVSVSSSGGQGFGASSFYPAISANGKFVAFLSFSTGLVSGDTNGLGDVFVHNRDTKETTRVSITNSGLQSTGIAGPSSLYAPSISSDGRYVTFVSSASDLISGDANGVGDVFVHDRVAKTTTRVSVSSMGGEGNGHSVNTTISADGRYMVFESYASNLIVGDTNSQPDIFVYDRETKRTSRVSISDSGQQGSAAHIFGDPAISADGRFVAFASAFSNLVPGDSNLKGDIFFHERLPAGVVGKEYRAALTAVNGVAPLRWSVKVGSLPSGLALDSSSGVISGMPSIAGVAEFTVEATDGRSVIGSRVLAIEIAGAPIVASLSSAPASSIMVLYPNSGELLMVDEMVTISWTSSGLVSKTVAIKILKDGNLFTTLGTKIPQNAESGTFSYTWSVPANMQNLTGFTIEISDSADPAIKDASDGPFRVGYAPASATWHNGWLPDTFIDRVNFTFATSSYPTVQSLRIYEKRPGDSAFNSVATFSLLVSWRCNSNVVSVTGWALDFGCGRSDPLGSLDQWTARRTSQFHSSTYLVGTYEYYVAAVDSSGNETILPPSGFARASSKIIKKYATPKVKIVSPSGAQTIGSPITFQWTLTSGWPVGTAPSYRIALYDSDTRQVYWQKFMYNYAPAGSITGSFVYDGPALDPAKKYIVLIDAGRIIMNQDSLAWDTYNAMPEVVTTIWIDSTALTTSTLSITTTNLPAGAWGISYFGVNQDGSLRSVALSATGGVAPYQWQIVGGNFPNGLKLAATGQISQWPLVVPGTYTFTAGVTDSAGASATKVLSIEVKSDQGGYWGGSQYDSHRFVRSVRFGFDRTKFTDVRAIRLYEKKPGETQFALSGSFPLASTACGTSVTTDLNWSLGFSCRTDYEAWTATSRIFDYGNTVPIGEYSYYVAVVDSTGIETIISDMLHQHALSSTRIISPTSAFSPVLQPFTIQWTVPQSGWPAHWASTITAGYSIHVHEEVSRTQVYRSTVSVPISSQTGSKAYDGPILDPAKLYRVGAYYSYLGIDYANRARVNYLTMTENPTTFLVNP